MKLTLSEPIAQAAFDAPPYHAWTQADGGLFAEFHRRGERYLIRFPDIADFEIATAADEVLCRPVPGSADAALRHLFFNQVLPLALNRQGKLVLHASAVQAGDGAVAFAGLSGRGKSTLAASFATSGTGFLTDDALILEPGDDAAYWVSPSHPSIRLWEDSHLNVLPDHGPSAPASEITPKSRFPAGEAIAFCGRSCRLRKVYFLGDGTASEVSITRASHSESLLAWIRNAFLLDIAEPMELAEQLRSPVAACT